jgi:hypothetical protein
VESDDHSAIVNVINLYPIAVDSHRYELFDRIFTEDIHCDFGGGAAFTDRTTLKAVFNDIHAGFAATQHITSGHAIVLNGDRANCLSYVHGFFRRKLDDGEGVFQSTGWYDDELVRTPEGWRIRYRISRMVSYGGDIRVMQAMPGVDTNYVLSALFEEADAGQSKFLQALEAASNR